MEEEKAERKLLLAQFQNPLTDPLTSKTIFTIPTNEGGKVELISKHYVFMQSETKAAVYERKEEDDTFFGRPFLKTKFPIRVYGLLVSEEVYARVKPEPEKKFEDDVTRVCTLSNTEYKYTLKPDEFDVLGVFEIHGACVPGITKWVLYTNEDVPEVQAYREKQAELDSEENSSSQLFELQRNDKTIGFFELESLRENSRDNPQDGSNPLQSYRISFNNGRFVLAEDCFKKPCAVEKEFNSADELLKQTQIQKTKTSTTTTNTDVQALGRLAVITEAGRNIDGPQTGTEVLQKPSEETITI